MTDNARKTGAAVEAHFQFLMWLVPAVEKSRSPRGLCSAPHPNRRARRTGVSGLRRPTRAIGAGTFAEGSSCTVTATPNGSHTFVDWTENGKVVSTSASYAFTMPSASITLVAHFK
jgi:Divergent InlB B-repeat domain